MVIFAQDRLGRDVVIKVVTNSGQEHQVYKRLTGRGELFDVETFPSVMPPLDIIPTPYDFSFVVMPRCVVFRRICPSNSILNLLLVGELHYRDRTGFRMSDKFYGSFLRC